MLSLGSVLLLRLWLGDGSLDDETLWREAFASAAQSLAPRTERWVAIFLQWRPHPYRRGDKSSKNLFEAVTRHCLDLPSCGNRGP